MKFSIPSLVATAALFSSSVGSPFPETFDVNTFDSTVMKQRQAIGDIAVLDAFKKQDCANASELFHDEDGESMLYYSFDIAEWNGMYDQLLVEEAFGSSPASPLSQHTVEHRQLDESDFYFMCTDEEERPWAYTNTMSYFTGGVCAGLDLVLISQGSSKSWRGESQISEKKGSGPFLGGHGTTTNLPPLRLAKRP